MLDNDCCHRRQRLVCPNMTTAKRKLVLVMCCACICSCASSASVAHSEQRVAAAAAAPEATAAADGMSPPTPPLQQPPLGTPYVDSLFRKYGGENGFMTVQGFEDLISNLGLVKTINSSQDVPESVSQTDHQHTVPDGKGSVYRTKNLDASRPLNNKEIWNQISQPKEAEIVSHCLSTSEIIRMVKKLDGSHKKIEADRIKNIEPDVHITPNTFLDLCSALIYQMDRKYCYSIGNSAKYDKIYEDRNSSKQESRHSFDQEIDEPVETNLRLEWLYASVSVFIISATGIVGIALVPFSRSPSYPQLLRFLVALAVGTLCGDALMHLLPHALMPHEHIHNHINIIGHHDNHNMAMYKCGLTFLTVLLFYSLETLLPIFNKDMRMHTHGHNHETKPELGSMLTGTENNQKDKFSPIALMIILGDALHNLTDGLAIGAAFSSDPVTGLATSIAVLCHELPHEFGDFAVLLRAGYTIKRVLYFNVMSSILSFIGMAIGLLLASGHAAASQWIYAATAGSFLYIALADLVPEMAAGNQKVLGNVLMQVLGIAVGGAIMLVIALKEDSLRSLFS